MTTLVRIDQVASMTTRERLFAPMPNDAVLEDPNVDLHHTVIGSPDTDCIIVLSTTTLN